MIRVLIAALALLAVSGCGRGASGAGSEDKTIRLITNDLWPVADSIPILKAEVEKQGYKLDWVVVNDIIQPNKLVDEGAADANQFQHEPYFDQFVTDHALKNIARGFYTLMVPSGLYSKRYKSLEDVPDGATIGIPVDPANNGRALFMLRDKGLLKLREGVEVTHVSQKDILENPHRFQFKEVDQLMQLRTLQDVDVCFLFGNYAVIGGFDPKRDALARENIESLPYRGMVAVRKELVGSPKIRALQNAYGSEAYKAYFRKSYRDVVVFLDPLNH